MQINFGSNLNSLEERSYVCQYDGTANNHHEHKDKVLHSIIALQLPLTTSRGRSAVVTKNKDMP